MSECSCPLQNGLKCPGNNVRTYFTGTDNEVQLCRQCATATGVKMIVNSCMDGGDVENVFRSIMRDLAVAKLPAKSKK
jgi:hypothetical protein